MTDDNDRWLEKRLDEFREDFRDFKSQFKSLLENTNQTSAAFEAFKVRYEFDRDRLDRRLVSIESSIGKAAEQADAAHDWMLKEEERRKLANRGLMAIGSIGTLVAGGLWTVRHQLYAAWSAIWNAK